MLLLVSILLACLLCVMIVMTVRVYRMYPQSWRFDLEKDDNDIYMATVNVAGRSVKLAVDTGSSHFVYGKKDLSNPNETLVYGSQILSVRRTRELVNGVLMGVAQYRPDPGHYNILGMSGFAEAMGADSFVIHLGPRKKYLELNKKDKDAEEDAEEDAEKEGAVRIPRVFLPQIPENLYVVMGSVEGKPQPVVLDTGSNTLTIGSKTGIRAPFSDISLGKGVVLKGTYTEFSKKVNGNFIERKCLIVPGIMLEGYHMLFEKDAVTFSKLNTNNNAI